MIGREVGIPDIVIELALLALTLGLILTFIRLVRGPSLPDRIVALELTATLVIGVSALYAIGTDEPALIEVAIALTLVVFLGAAALARYAERAMRRA